LADLTSAEWYGNIGTFSGLYITGREEMLKLHGNEHQGVSQHQFGLVYTSLCSTKSYLRFIESMTQSFRSDSTGLSVFSPDEKKQLIKVIAVDETRALVFFDFFASRRCNSNNRNHILSDAMHCRDM
jgi:hypothetical protein